MSRGGSRAAALRILSREECQAVFERVRAFARGGGDTAIDLSCWWQGELRWGRNQVTLASDRREVRLQVTREIPPSFAGRPFGLARATTNQLDDASLEAAVRAAERAVYQSAFAPRYGEVGSSKGRFDQPLPEFTPPTQAIWSDATYNLTTEARGEVARGLIEPAEAKGMLSAGYIEVRAGSWIRIGTNRPDVRQGGKQPFWEQPYVRWTQAQCSMTVRNPKGTGSGWAANSSYDWTQIDTAALTARALEKCIASQDPVALEPGRYTVILEPAAVADLVEPLLGSFQDRGSQETFPASTWYQRPGFSKLGLKVMDNRITIGHDPADPRLGIVMEQSDRPGPVNWVEKGVLVNLGHPLDYSVSQLGDQNSLRGAIGYRMSGGPASVDEMIRTTKRGLLVTRFSNVQVLNGKAYLQTGVTRDGLWLIEEGKITKAVKNFRFTESPLFMLNSLEQLGEPVPVFRPTKNTDERLFAEGGRLPELTPALVPPLKARDFSFTAMIDGV